MTARTDNGFTLVEMLVGLLVFSLIAAAGVGVLRLSIDNRFAVGQSTERTAALQRTRALLRADLAQAADRRVRDDDGRVDPQALSGGDAVTLLALTRRGWSNPGQAPRASMQRVEYRLDGKRLERRVRSALDGGALGEPQLLEDGVETAAIAFIDRGRETPVWSPTPDRPLPEAVRLTLTLEGYGPVTQLFLVGSERS